MTAEIFNLRDYQSKKGLAQLTSEQDLQRQAQEIMNVALLGQSMISYPYDSAPSEMNPGFVDNDQSAS